MFEKPTVIVLGAGASWHYNYPTGEELIGSIKLMAITLRDRAPELLQYPDVHTHIKERFRDATGFKDQLRILIEKLHQIEPLIIDYFLGQNPEIAELGKVVIACVLLTREFGYEVMRSDPSNVKKDWCRFLIQGLLDGYQKPENLAQNDIAFVTFNYDISLERRLFTALNAIDALRIANKAREFLKSSRVTHVYGKLKEDYFSGLTYSESDARLQFVQILLAAFEASKGIKTIAPFEKIADDSVVAARKLLREAGIIYFLGYGFDRNNNELLDLDELFLSGISKEIYFTNFGNQNKVSKAVARIFNVTPNDLLGNNYIAENNSFSPVTGITSIRVEKSIRNVYDALAVDFNWPD